MSGVGLRGALLVVLVVGLMLGTFPLGVAGSGSPASAGPSEAAGPGPSAPGPSGVAVHYGHPVGASTLSSTGGGPGSIAATGSAAPPWNCTPPGTVPFPVVGLNFTLTSTPANGTGPAPLNFSWNISIGSGGLPPFHPWLTFSTGSVLLTSYNATGNITLGQAGLWSVQVLVEDATCTQEGATEFQVMAWTSALGPHPVVLNATPLTAAAPANVTYTLVAPSIPAGWSLFWVGLGFYPYLPVEDHTYYLPGTYNATACLVEPDGTDYACGSSPDVNVTGPSPIQTGVTVATGSYPVNVTFWANITNASAFPNGTSIHLYAWNGTSGNSVSTTNRTANLTESVGCGYPWTPWAVPTGNCLETGSVVLTGPTGSPNDGDLLQLPLSVLLAANGSPVNWWPSVSYTYGPANGTAPLNVSLNISAVNGLAPYFLQWAVAGDSGNGTNSTFYNTTGGSVVGWNGTLITITLPLLQQGYYWIVVSVVATNFGFVNFALPLVLVGNATVPVFSPLSVNAAESRTNGSIAGNATVGDSFQFVATPQGGEGPYTVQWNFGDGQFASSIPGVAVDHTYSSAGDFVPTVTITDARGHQATSVLPTVHVVLTRGGGGSGTRNGSGGGLGETVGPSTQSAPSWSYLALGAVVAAAFILAALFLFRREVGREGEALVAGLDPDERAPAPRRRT